MTANNQLNNLVLENQDKVGQLSVSIETLDAVQFAVRNLMDTMSTSMHRGFFSHCSRAKYAADEIQIKLRVIDKAFQHVNMDIQNEISMVKDLADEFDKIIESVNLG